LSGTTHRAAGPGPRTAAGWSCRGTVHGMALKATRWLLVARVPFANYLRSCQSGPQLSGEAQPPSSAVWPCPPPYSWAQGRPPRSPRRRARWVQRAGEQVWVNLMTALLSYLATGLSPTCPSEARAGRPLGAMQKEAVVHLHECFASMSRPGIRPRAAGPKAADLEELGAWLEEQAAGLERACKYGETAAVPAAPRGQAVLQVKAERLGLPEEISDFDARPFLSPASWAAWTDPSLHSRKPDEGLACPCPRGTCSYKEELAVFRRWDKIGRLSLFAEEELEADAPRRVARLTAVPKTAEEDRQILDMLARNWRQAPSD
jgi:hypothetical protein